METAHYANGITAENLRALLELWPMLSTEMAEAQEGVVEIKKQLLNDDTKPFSWCYLYELPVREHISIANIAIAQGLGGLLQMEQFMDWFKQIVDTPGQIGALPSVIGQVSHHFDAIEPNKEIAKSLCPSVAAVFGSALSLYNSIRCVLYHGCYLNELIERIRDGNDKALFDAVRIDPTVIGCPSVNNRISKAALMNDNRFFTKLKAAINGKMAKREQDNFQKMRLVLEVLHEAGATRLSDAQLNQLFVEELDLYTSNLKEGGSAKALRKFSDSYMKKLATT